MKYRKKLEESERNLRVMIMQAPIGIAIFRQENFVVEIVNDRALELWGRTLEEVWGKPILQGMPELLEQGIMDLLEDVYKTGKPFYANELPVELLRKNKKEIVYISFGYEALYDENGKINGIMATGIDVSEHVLTRREIEESEQRFQAAVNAVCGNIWTNSPDGRMEGEQPGWEKLTGQSYEEYQGFGWSNVIHPEDAAATLEAWNAAVANNSDFVFTHRVKMKDGNWGLFNVNAIPLLDPQGNITQWVGVHTDITKQHTIEQELKDSEARFRLLADSMPQFVWAGDKEGNLNYFNQSVYNYSGLSREEVEKNGWIQIVHPDEREKNIAAWVEAITAGNNFIFEHRFKRRDGEYRWQLSRAIPYRNENGEIEMWVGTSTDIEEQKIFSSELERQVQERTKELEEKNNDLQSMNKELQSFAYVSSHDLQEPLRKIQTFADRILTKEKEQLSENAQYYFSRMQEAANRMQQLIEDLLAYSRTNNAEKNFEVVNIATIIGDVGNEMKEYLQEKNAKLNVKNACEARIIPFQFRQLMQNLISNSLKFAFDGRNPVINIDSKIADGKTLKRSDLSAGRKYCHIIYTDNGIGFEQQYADKIFEVFQRLHSSSSFQGTGIGLAIVKKIIDNHHGYITASGVLNEGARFDIYIPLN